MYSRDHVDAMIVYRQLRPKPTDLPEYVVERDYLRLYGTIERAADLVLGDMQGGFPGFTEDDLRSIFAMKAHQVIRRGWYEPGRDPRKLFVVAFKHTVRDMLRCHERAVNRGLEVTAFDLVVTGYLVDERTEEPEAENYAPGRRRERISLGVLEGS